jgi:hypothetical protein
LALFEHAAQKLADRVQRLIRRPMVVGLALSGTDKSELLWFGLRRRLLRSGRRFYRAFVACS